jgi:GNAT superfamily N-acetyltransferase
MLEETVGSRAALIMKVFERFEAAHPHDKDHYYLSLLGTHPDHRGHGLGMGLLADNLTHLDAEGAAAYLESTNPANLRRYESVGFEVYGSFGLPEGGPSVTTMWRAPQR